MIRASVIFSAVLLSGVALVAPDLFAQQKPSAAERTEIKAVISRQIKAFRHDDAKEAFSLASPGIQQTFRTPEDFLRMVKTMYQPVYRPASVTFQELSVIEDEVMQAVQLSDSPGAIWIALYPMQRQSDGSWKTHSCQVFKAASVLT